MNSGITRLPASAMPPEAGQQGDRQAAANGSQPILSAVVALMHDRPAELQNEKLELEAEVRRSGLSQGIYYSMLGEVDAKLAQSTPGQVDKAV